MELKLLLGFLASMFGSLFGKMLVLEQAPLVHVKDLVKPLVIADRKVSRAELEVPLFVTNVPKEHFAGISEPLNSLAKARKSAIDNVIQQILGSIETKYDYKYFNRVYGNIRNIQRVIDDKLSGTAHGIVLDVERNIVNSFWLMDGSGKFVYFVLVYYPEQKIREMRRLSKGAQVIASVTSNQNGHVRLKISEINGVEVTMSSADIKIRKRNKFAKAVTLFLWRVPSGSVQNYSVNLDPVKVCGNSKHTELSLDKIRKKLADYLLGADFERIVMLKGHDEIGRPISIEFAF